MLPVSDAFKNAIIEPSREFRAKVIFNNMELDDDNIQSVEYSNSIVESEDFEIGTACMATMDLEILDLDKSLEGYPFEGKEVNVELGINVGDDTFEYVGLGYYTIERPIRKDGHIRLTAVDRMHLFEKTYYSTLPYPATLGQIADDVCSFAGVELFSSSFPNSGYVVNLRPNLERVTCRGAISQIAELAGGYARITRDGKLEIFNINTSIKNEVHYAGDGYFASNEHFFTDEITSGMLDITRDNYITFENSEFNIPIIDRVIVTAGEAWAEEGVGDNVYYIEDNIFCQDPNGVIKGIFGALNGLSYMPFQVNWQGNPAIEPGDAITIKTVSGHFNTIATSRSLTYNGGLLETYTAAGKSEVEKQSTSKGTITVEVENTKSEIKALDEKTEGLVTTEDFDTFKTQTGKDLSNRIARQEFELFQEDVDYELNQKISRGNDLKTEVTQSAETWGLSIDGKLNGDKYSFDGFDFKLGNSATDVEHTPSLSKWKHGDGSYTQVSSDGLERIVNGFAKKYHDLTVIGELTTDSSPITVFLGDDFKGKNFVVIPFLKGVVDITDHDFINNIVLDVVERSTQDATVTFIGKATIRITETDDNGFIKDLGTGTANLIIGYVAIA